MLLNVEPCEDRPQTTTWTWVICGSGTILLRVQQECRSIGKMTLPRGDFAFRAEKALPRACVFLSVQHEAGDGREASVSITWRGLHIRNFFCMLCRHTLYLTDPPQSRRKAAAAATISYLTRSASHPAAMVNQLGALFGISPAMKLQGSIGLQVLPS